MGRLDNRVAIVTGAAMGIGRAAVLALARDGARVAVSDINEADGQAVVKEVRDSGGEAFFQAANVATSADIERLVSATVERYGRLDVLVNNVGVAIAGTVEDLTEEQWDKTININLTSVWRGMKFAIPHMKANETGGSIINISSVQGLVGFSGWAAYAASKGGINALTQQAAVEYAPFNIRINAIAPGTIMTPMNERILEATEDKQTLLTTWYKLHPMGRFGRSEEVGSLIAFLASDDSSFITGDIIRIDGGLVIKAG